MSSQQQAFEAARTRIQKLVEEIAALSKKEMRSEEFFQQFIARSVQACDGKGGAVWLVQQRTPEGKGEFQLAAQVEFESSLFQTDEQQRAMLLRALGGVVQTGKSLVFPPAQHRKQPTPGSLEAHLAPAPAAPGEHEQNKTPYPFVHVPIFLKEQVIGVLQIWLQPYVTPDNYSEFTTFLGTLAQHVDQHLQSRRLGTIVVENQRLQHVLRFTSDTAGVLDQTEAARLAANYARDLLGCERCAIIALDHGDWDILAVSGQETVEKKSSMLKAMVAFVQAHAKQEIVVVSKKELVEKATNPVPEEGTTALVVSPTSTVDTAYFEMSQVQSAILAPMLDADKKWSGVLFAESTTEKFFNPSEPGSPNKLAEYIGTHTGRVLSAASDHQSLPFLWATRRMRDTKRAILGPQRARKTLKWALTAIIAGGICFYPKMDQVDANCGLTPTRRAAVVGEVSGRIDRIFVRENQAIKKGDKIAQLDTRRLEAEIEVSRKERARLTAEADRLRASNEDAQAHVANLQAQAQNENLKRLQLDLEAATLRSPIDGVVLTKDIELHVGETLQAGTPLGEIGTFEKWTLEIEVDEKQIGKVEEHLDAKETLPVSYHLYSQSAQELHAKLITRDQISAAAQARDHSSVFIVSIREVDIPASMATVMRPGLTGRAHIELGRRPLILIYAKRIWNWARLRWIG